MTQASREQAAETKKRRTREAIMRAAKECWDEIGFRETTTRDIIKRAGVGQATYYNHFPTKSVLLHAIQRAELPEAERQAADAADARRAAFRARLQVLMQESLAKYGMTEAEITLAMLEETQSWD